MYLMISMTAVLAAIWVGLWFAGRFVAPIRRLIGAAQEVSTGNLQIELPEKRGEGDLRRLSQTFNTMTRELKNQRDALVTANDQLVERRHFMEAVLSGVSAGVIGLDSQDRITLVSRAASDLLGLVEGDLVGKKLKDAIPLFGAILDRQDDHIAQAALAGRGDVLRRGRGAHVRRDGDARARQRRRRRLGSHLRRRDGSCRRPAHGSLGRRRPAHRARDQEPADPHTTCRRAAAQEVRQEHHARTARRSTG